MIAETDAMMTFEGLLVISSSKFAMLVWNVISLYPKASPNGIQLLLQAYSVIMKN